MLTRYPFIANFLTCFFKYLEKFSRYFERGAFVIQFLFFLAVCVCVCLCVQVITCFVSDVCLTKKKVRLVHVLDVVVEVLLGTA